MMMILIHLIALVAILLSIATQSTILLWGVCGIVTWGWFTYLMEERAGHHADDLRADSAMPPSHDHQSKAETQQHHVQGMCASDERSGEQR